MLAIALSYGKHLDDAVIYSRCCSYLDDAVIYIWYNDAPSRLSAMSLRLLLDGESDIAKDRRSFNSAYDCKRETFFTLVLSALG